MSTLFAKTRPVGLSPLRAEGVYAVVDGHHGMAEQLVSLNGEPHNLSRQYEPRHPAQDSGILRPCMNTPSTRSFL